MSSFSLASSAPPARRWSGWLIASVAINLLLAGLILAWAIKGPPHQPMVGWQKDIMSSLSPGDAAIMEKATTTIASEQMHGDLLMHAQFAKVRAAIGAQPFEKTPLEQALNGMGAIRNDQQTTIGRIFLDELTALSPDGRSKMLAALEKESHRWRPPTH